MDTLPLPCQPLPPATARRPCHPPDTEHGFTLIELMITLALLAIITVVAIPSYADYTRRGKLTEAFNQLTAQSIALEQYYQDNRTYVGACGSSGNTQLPTATSNFAYACNGLTATGYVVQATGQSGSAVSGFQFTITQSGARATPAAPSGWPTNANCWVNSKSGACQ